MKQPNHVIRPQQFNPTLEETQQACKRLIHSIYGDNGTNQNKTSGNTPTQKITQDIPGYTSNSLPGARPKKTIF